MGPNEATCESLAPSGSSPPPLAYRTLRRQNPRQEPSAVVLPAGIRGGGAARVLRRRAVPTAATRQLDRSTQLQLRTKKVLHRKLSRAHALDTSPQTPTRAVCRRVTSEERTLCVRGGTQNSRRQYSSASPAALVLVRPPLQSSMLIGMPIAQVTVWRSH
jgi:hypothetical protein